MAILVQNTTPPHPVPAGNWNVEYFNDTTITNKCAGTLACEGPYVFKDWGDNGPASSCNSNNWSARFGRTVHFQGGTYNFGLGSFAIGTTQHSIRFVEQFSLDRSEKAATLKLHVETGLALPIAMAPSGHTEEEIARIPQQPAPQPSE